ncbi:MAG: hypothetical protein M3Q56_08025 [Bacteroidota bacterium]|nr:hypothetical protein [Bacteroidota bacterium]
MHHLHFLHSQWNLPDLHFQKTDWEQDHPYHEFCNIEMVAENGEGNILSIDTFLAHIKKI